MSKSEKGIRKTPLRRRVDGPFAENLRSILKSKKISLKAASRLASVSPAVLHAWCNGGAPQDYLAVHRLADALAVDFQWLLTGRPAAPVNPKNLTEVFDLAEEPAFSGVFLLEAKRLKRKE